MSDERIVRCVACGSWSYLLELCPPCWRTYARGRS